LANEKQQWSQQDQVRGAPLQAADSRRKTAITTVGERFGMRLAPNPRRQTQDH
jgi:hypothetical protein